VHPKNRGHLKKENVSGKPQKENDLGDFNKKRKNGPWGVLKKKKGGTKKRSRTYARKYQHEP